MKSSKYQFTGLFLIFGVAVGTGLGLVLFGTNGLLGGGIGAGIGIVLGAIIDTVQAKKTAG